MFTVAELVRQLPDDLIDVVFLPHDATTVRVSGLTIPEPTRVGGPAGLLVLAVRVADAADAVAALTDVHDCSAMVLPTGIANDAVVATAERTGVALFALRPGVTWVHAIAVLDGLFSAGVGASGTVGEPGPESEGDLFELAEALAVRLGTPVTIEDPQSRVIAFSTHHERVDVARVETVMRRQVPSEYLVRMREHGVFRRLLAEDRPIVVSGRQPDIEPRLAIAIRAGREVLGSIWAVTDGHPTAEDERVLTQGAAAVAVQLLRRRQSSDYERRVHTDTVRQLLAGDASAAGSVAWLGRAGREHVVVAVGVVAEAQRRKDVDWELQSVADALRTHLMATAPESLAAVVDGTVYAVVSLSSGHARSGATLRRFLTDFVAGTTRPGSRRSLRVGIGTRVAAAVGLPGSRAMADLVVTVLRDRPLDGPVASIEDVGGRALMTRCRETVRGVPELGAAAVQRIRAYDEEHQTVLGDTLYAWLCCHGSCDQAARELHVHANTVRYRVRQLRDLALIDLDDPDERVAAYLHLSA